MINEIRKLFNIYDGVKTCKISDTEKAFNIFTKRCAEYIIIIFQQMNNSRLNVEDTNGFICWVIDTSIIFSL